MSEHTEGRSHIQELQTFSPSFGFIKKQKRKQKKSNQDFLPVKVMYCKTMYCFMFSELECFQERAVCSDTQDKMTPTPLELMHFNGEYREHGENGSFSWQKEAKISQTRVPSSCTVVSLGPRVCPVR